MYKFLSLQLMEECDLKKGDDLKFWQMFFKSAAFCMLVVGQKDLSFVGMSLASSLLSKSLDVYHRDHSNTRNAKTMMVLNGLLFIQSLSLALKFDSDDKEHVFGFQVAALSIMLLTLSEASSSVLSKSKTE